MQSAFRGNGSWPDDASQEMQPGNKDAGGPSGGSNTGGAGKGSRRIRQWQRLRRKVQCKQKNSLLCFRLTLALRVVGWKATAGERAPYQRLAEHTRKVLQLLALQCEWGAKPQSAEARTAGVRSKICIALRVGSSRSPAGEGPRPTWGAATHWDRVLSGTRRHAHHTSTLKLIPGQVNADGVLLEYFSPWATNPENMWALVPQVWCMAWLEVQGKRPGCSPRGYTLKKGSHEAKGRSWAGLVQILWWLRLAKLSGSLPSADVTTLRQTPGTSGWEAELAPGCPCTAHLPLLEDWTEGVQTWSSSLAGLSHHP